MKRAIDVEICRDRLTLSANCVVPSSSNSSYSREEAGRGHSEQKVASLSHKGLPKSHFMTTELYRRKIAILTYFATVFENHTKKTHFLSDS